MLVRGTAVYGGSFTCTSTTPQDLPVRILDFVDPFGTGSAQQPLGFDQWAYFYNRGKVVGTKIIYTAHNSGTEPVVIGIDLVGEYESVDISPWDYRCEKPGCKYRILSAEIDHATMTYKVSTKRVFKIKDIKDTEEIACDLDTPASPSRGAWLNPWAALHNGTTSTTVDIIIKVEYIVLLDQPKIPARSVGT